MTVEEIRCSTKDVLLPDDIAEVLGVHPQSIRSQAHSAPQLLGFPVSVVGSRTLIPRLPFLAFLGVIKIENEQPAMRVSLKW